MIRDSLADAVRRGLSDFGVDPGEVVLERPNRPEHGDWSTNAALVHAKASGKNPRELAQALADALNAAPPEHVARVDIAGPGFVNFHLQETWLHEVLLDVVAAGEDYGRHEVAAGTKVNVEFVSGNPTGPLHAGHGRNAAYGDSVARLFERCGHQVEREYYVNDRGTQMDLYARSLVARKAGGDVPEGGYQGEYIVEWAQEMPDDAEALAWGEQRALDDHRRVLEQMNVHFDTWTSERALVGRGAVDEALEDLASRGVTYEADGALWLRTTDAGDDKDRVLIKSDGEYTYLLPDIAYHRDKFSRGFDLLVDVWGADHHGHISRVKAAIAELGHDPDELEVLTIQLVNLVRAGEPVRLSKRAGDIIELADVLEEVGPDAARLTYLLQSVDSPQTFDLEVVASQAMENPVYYVQYAHARIASIGRVAAERGVERLPIDQVDVGLLTHDRELDVLRSLSELPEVVLGACLARAPHQVTTWVRELAAAFHGFYHDCYVMGEGVSPELTQARLWLVEAAQTGLAVGLDLLGVSAPDSM